MAPNTRHNSKRVSPTGKHCRFIQTMLVSCGCAQGPGADGNLWSAAELQEMLDPGLDPHKRQKDGSQCLQGSVQVGLSFHHSTLIIEKEKPSRDL